MKGIIRIVRGAEVKISLPASTVTEKSNGSLWAHGMPILGITDKSISTKMAALVRAGKTEKIPAKYFTRLGDNQNGLWAGDDEAWATHPAKIATDKAAAIKATEDAKTVKIYLSSRGWGDYSPCEWIGDITRPDTEILAECKHLLATQHDVDQRTNQSDADLLTKIDQARDNWEKAPASKAAREAAENKDIQRKIDTGYCFFCESWCYGDCGHYSKDPMTKFRRDLREAEREANYGIND